MDINEKFEKAIGGLVGVSLNKIAYLLLIKSSKKYKELFEENEKLQKEFPFINGITDGTELDETIFSIDDYKALLKFYKNKMMLEDMERIEIYKLGFHAAIKMLYPICTLDKSVNDSDDTKY